MCPPSLYELINFSSIILFEKNIFKWNVNNVKLKVPFTCFIHCFIFQFIYKRYRWQNIADTVARYTKRKGFDS